MVSVSKIISRIALYIGLLEPGGKGIKGLFALSEPVGQLLHSMAGFGQRSASIDHIIGSRAFFRIGAARC